MDSSKRTKEILIKCVKDIIDACGLYTNDVIDAILIQSLDDIDAQSLDDIDAQSLDDIDAQSLDDIDAQSLDDINNIDMYGKCCYCKDECNPMSQSCGSCARGLSGAVIGLPVPGHLQKFM